VEVVARVNAEDGDAAKRIPAIRTVFFSLLAVASKGIGFCCSNCDELQNLMALK
jgi:hypothetical protein